MRHDVRHIIYNNIYKRKSPLASLEGGLLTLAPIIRCCRGVRHGAVQRTRFRNPVDLGGFLDFSLDFWISGFQSGFLDFKVDFWISKWISGFQVDFWISKWISGFQADFWISKRISGFRYF